MTTHYGACHCGNLEVLFETTLPKSNWPIRKCSCTFCAKQNARYVTDPEGGIEIKIEHRGALTRYRFGQENADFFICGACGIYIGAIHRGKDDAFMTLNVNCLELPPDQKPSPVDYTGEAEPDRLRRWHKHWTPVRD